MLTCSGRNNVKIQVRVTFTSLLFQQFAALLTLNCGECYSNSMVFQLLRNASGHSYLFVKSKPIKKFECN